jgi:hypothetical protein
VKTEIFFENQQSELSPRNGQWSVGEEGLCYYPFGMPLIGRNFYGENGYRFGFGGHEKIDELKGSGNHLAFGDYGYDARLGRRWNIDPVDQINISNYATLNMFRLTSPATLKLVIVCQ